MELAPDHSNHDVGDTEYIVKLLLILQRTHPFPGNLKTLTMSPDMFERSSSHTSALIVYLLSIIDRKLCSTQVPGDSSSRAKFNQGVINFCRQIPKAPWNECTGKYSLGTTLKTRSGRQFTLFILQLAKYALRTICTKEGYLNVPLIANMGERDKRCAVLEAKERKFTYELLRTFSKKASSAETLSALENDDLMLEKLQKTKEALMEKSISLIEKYPRQYLERLQGESPEQRLTTASIILRNEWLLDIERSIAEQNEKHLTVRQVWKEHVNIPTIRRNELINERNVAVLQNIASNSKCPLHIGADLSLTGFLNSSFSVVEKLNKLLRDSALTEQAKSSGVLKDALLTNAEDTKLIAELTSEVESSLKETKRKYEEYEVKYEESVAKRGGHRFPFPEWDTMPMVKVDVPEYEGNSLISSPADAIIVAAIDDARKALRSAQRDSPVARTANPRPRKLFNSSVSSLTRSALQVKSWTLGGREGDSTVGDIEPLSASSPHGSVRVIPMNPSISEIIGDEDELRDTFSDSSEWSASLDLPSTSSVEPARVGRRTSLDQCVERFNELKKKLKYRDT